MKLNEAYILTEKNKDDTEYGLVGRRRLAKSIKNILSREEGLNVSMPKIMSYLYSRCDKEESWGKEVVKKSKALGFDPHEWFEKAGEPGYSKGQMNNPGRKYFFTVVRDLSTRHFMKESGKDSSTRPMHHKKGK